jgi:hypothetical protein
MKYPMYMSPEDSAKLEYEIVSDDLKIYLTRVLEKWTEDTNTHENTLIRKNRLVNKSRMLVGKPNYVLESDEIGGYMPQEYAWHDGDMALVLRRLKTPQFAELLCDFVNDGLYKCDELNELLKRDGVSFRINDDNERIKIEVLSLEDIEELDSSIQTHPNIRLLVSRMDGELQKNDYSGVLHSSATIFETLAKIIVNESKIENQTLKSFFDRYRKDSNMPEAILDYIINIYECRNVTPLAGHGSTKEPNLTQKQAIIMAEMTKAFVKIEYRLQIEC